MTKRIIAANWKMNNAFEEADTWLETVLAKISENQDKVEDSQIVLCPPVFMIDYVDSELMESGFQKLETILKYQNKDIADLSEEELTSVILSERSIKLGAQDCHSQISGSFTGDVSAESLSKIGCEYVILGHSERRVGHFETNEVIASKVKAAVEQELTPIICVGESKESRDQNQHLEFVKEQILKSIPRDVKFEKLVIAYEPIWSIGTGLIPNSQQILEVSNLVKEIFNDNFTEIADEYFLLYGGSVSIKNSADIMAVEGIGGLLVGKASLNAEEFFDICVS